MKWRLPSWIRSVRVPAGVRSLAAGAAAVVGALFLLGWFERSRPLNGWFILDLATIWFWTLVLSAACVLGGPAGGRTLAAGPGPDRARDAWRSRSPAGVVVFVLAMYAGGFTHLFNRPFAVALPALMLIATARPTVEWLRRQAAPGSGYVALRGLPLVLTVLGICLVFLLYLGAMSPDAINYDATWLHLVIPQDYAREGRIVSFPGDQVKNVPHLGGMLCTWGFLVPGLDMPQLRWMMALHIEFSVFLWTLVAIAAAARWFAQREARATWTALALFPGIFVYDSNMGGAADHFLALFAAPLLLVTAKTVNRFDRRTAVLAGLIAGGALMSKLQALYLLAPLAVWALARAGRLLVRRSRGDRDAPAPRANRGRVRADGQRGPGGAAASPHQQRRLLPQPDVPRSCRTSSRTARPRCAMPLTLVRQRPRGLELAPACPAGRAARARVRDDVHVLVRPPLFVRERDARVGSVFTLRCRCWCRSDARGRVWLGAALVLGMVFTWAMSYWVDRNLQAFLPVMSGGHRRDPDSRLGAGLAGARGRRGPARGPAGVGRCPGTSRVRIG
jgi:hypothetical protein